MLGAFYHYPWTHWKKFMEQMSGTFVIQDTHGHSLSLICQCFWRDCQNIFMNDFSNATQYTCYQYRSNLIGHTKKSRLTYVFLLVICDTYEP